LKDVANDEHSSLARLNEQPREERIDVNRSVFGKSLQGQIKIVLAQIDLIFSKGSSQLRRGDCLLGFRRQRQKLRNYENRSYQKKALETDELLNFVLSEERRTDD